MQYLITGGTGTFGHIASAFLLADPATEKVVIFSRDEQKQVEMQRAFSGEERMRFFIGDVRDQERLVQAFRHIDFVFHAAAMKMVPKCEYDPIEAVKTNIDGTRAVIEAALKTAVRRVLLVSTDKAVAPVNLYGATKLTAERLIVAANNLSGWREPYFSVVRYGNVTGSRGSVLPIWGEAARRRRTADADAPGDDALLAHAA